MSECRNYSNKVWGEINRELQAQQEPIVKEKEEKARVLQEEIDKMTLLVADQDADIKAKQEYIVKLEQDIKVRLAEIEAINNVRDYFNTPEFRQRVSDKKKKRKMEMLEEEVVEEEIDETPKSQNGIVDILTTDNRDEKMKVEEQELLEKLRQVNKDNSNYNEELERINKRKKEEADIEANPFASFANLQTDIEKENKEYLNNQKELKDSIDSTIKKVEDSEEKEEPVENQEEKSESSEPENAAEVEEGTKSGKKKPSLQGLLDSANKLKKYKR